MHWVLVDVENAGLKFITYMFQQNLKSPQLCKRVQVTAFTKKGLSAQHQLLLSYSRDSSWLKYKQASSNWRDAADVCIVLEMERLLKISSPTDIISVVHGGDKIYPTLVHQMNQDSNTNRCREYKTTRLVSWCNEVLGTMSINDYLAVPTKFVPRYKLEHWYMHDHR